MIFSEFKYLLKQYYFYGVLNSIRKKILNLLLIFKTIGKLPKIKKKPPSDGVRLVDLYIIKIFMSIVYISLYIY